jgi:hypothetical protein
MTFNILKSNNLNNHISDRKIRQNYTIKAIYILEMLRNLHSRFQLIETMI